MRSPISFAPSHRRWLTLLLAGACLSQLGLAGCSSSGSNATAASSTGASSTAAASATITPTTPTTPTTSAGAPAPITAASTGVNVGEVVVALLAYSPAKSEVKAGATVTWLQKDPGAHTVTSGTVEQNPAGVTKQPDGRFDSGNIATGKSFSFTFKDAGTYTYFCALHPATMRAEIHVI